MLTVQARLKKGDKAKHKWDSDGIVKKTIVKKSKKQASDAPKVSVTLVYIYYIHGFAFRGTSLPPNFPILEKNAVF